MILKKCGLNVIFYRWHVGDFFEDSNNQQYHDNYEYELSERRYATFFGTNREWVDELVDKSSNV